MVLCLVGLVLVGFFADAWVGVWFGGFCFFALVVFLFSFFVSLVMLFFCRCVLRYVGCGLFVAFVLGSCLGGWCGVWFCVFGVCVGI